MRPFNGVDPSAFSKSVLYYDKEANSYRQGPIEETLT